MWKKIKKMILQLLFPLRCPVCDDIVRPYGEKICTGCIGKLKLITPPWCMKCGKKLLKEQEYCADCKRSGHKYIRGRALYEYSSAVSGVYRFKYGGRQEYAEFFGEEMAKYLGEFIRSVKPDALIPVPLHRKRKNDRGYNQAKLLADVVGKQLKIPVNDKIVYRVKNTIPLKKQKPKERQNNLKKAFIVRQNDVKLKKVVLVDDIYTTGSTMDEISATLAEYGVLEIYFVTLTCGEGI